MSENPVDSPSYSATIVFMGFLPNLLSISSFFISAVVFAPEAKAEMKVGTIDMQKVFTAYYKTADAQSKLQEAQKAYKEELDQRLEAYKANLDLINKLNDELKQPALTDGSNDQKTQDRDAKITETKGLEKEIADFRQTREKQIQDQMKRMRDGIVDEIMTVINDQVKTTNYDIVFDKSGFSANNIVPVVLYARDSYDFSDSVITKLNSARPTDPGLSSQKPLASTENPTTTKSSGDAVKKHH
jgi:outer membrane protein